MNQKSFPHRCPSCFAEIGEDLTECPKCGSPVPLPVNNDVLRGVVKFSFVAPLYSKPKLLFNEAGELVRVETEFRLYRGVREPAQPPFIIFDTDGYVNVKRDEYSLVRLDEENLLKIEEAVPKSVWKKVVKTHSIASLDDEDDGEESVAYRLWRAGFIVSPVPRLRDGGFLKKFDWHGFVEDIINFKGVEMDPRLKLVRRCHLMRGIKQQINPHAIIVLPGQTGKSEWYHHVGLCDDKVTANSLIGFADADAPHPGSLDGTEVCYALDQIESSGMFMIFRYLLSLLEIGEARVDMAAIPFTIHSLSPIAILSNPIGDPKSTFAVLIEKMSKNPSLGRRFGVILYDKDAVRIKKREKDLDVLKEKVALFRAVEEYALPEIKKIVNNDEVWAWLNKRNEEWIRQALNLIEPIELENENLYLFLREFIENGGAHTRGGALRAALTMNLDKIALKDYSLQEIISEAEEYLHELLRINYESIQKIAAVYQETKEEGILRLFDTLPRYMKEIVSAVELWRRSLTEKKHGSIKTPYMIYLSNINYKPESASYFSEVLKTARRSNPERYNESLKEHFQFEVKQENKDLAVWIYSLEPLPFLKVLGNLDNLDNLAKFREDNFSGEEGKKAKTERKKEDSEEKIASPKNAKISKISKMSKKGLTAQDCEFWKTSNCKAGIPSAILPDNPCPETCDRFKPRYEGAFK